MLIFSFRIRSRLTKSFMFMALGEEDLDIVIDAMDEKKVSVGEAVITQGEKGNELYVVEEGHLDCFKIFVTF